MLGPELLWIVSKTATDIDKEQVVLPVCHGQDLVSGRSLDPSTLPYLFGSHQGTDWMG